MPKKLSHAAVARKCEMETQFIPPEVTKLHHGSVVVPETPSFIAHISKVIGRKEFCYRLRISMSLLDQWMSGEKKDPIERVRDIMRVAAECYGPDLPLDIAQELVDEFNGLIVRKRTKGGE